MGQKESFSERVEFVNRIRTNRRGGVSREQDGFRDRVFLGPKPARS